MTEAQPTALANISEMFSHERHPVSYNSLGWFSQAKTSGSRAFIGTYLLPKNGPSLLVDVRERGLRSTSPTMFMPGTPAGWTKGTAWVSEAKRLKKLPGVERAVQNRLRSKERPHWEYWVAGERILMTITYTGRPSKLHPAKIADEVWAALPALLEPRALDAAPIASWIEDIREAAATVPNSPSWDYRTHRAAVAMQAEDATDACTDAFSDALAPDAVPDVVPYARAAWHCAAIRDEFDLGLRAIAHLREIDGKSAESFAQRLLERRRVEDAAVVLSRVSSDDPEGRRIRQALCPRLGSFKAKGRCGS